MAKNSTGQTGPSAPQSRRKPVTIDLPAEEVAHKEAESAAAASGAPPATHEKAAKTPETASKPEAAGPSWANPEAPSEPRATGVSASAAKSPSTKLHSRGEDRSKAQETILPSAFAQPTRKDSAQKEEGAGREPSREAARRSFVPVVAAAIVGGAVVALVVVVLALAGFFRPPQEGAELAGEIGSVQAEVAALKDEIAALKETPAEDGLAPIREELAALRQSVSRLESAPAAAPDEGALQAVQDRLVQLEESVAETAAGAPSNEAGARLAARLNALAGEIEALKRGAPPDLSGLENGLAELRREVGALSSEVEGLPRADRIASIEAKLGETSEQAEKAAALGPAVAADALAAAADAGRPFTSELAALQALGVDAEVAALEPHAATGMPTLAAIRARFETEVAGLDLSQPIAEGAGALDRLLESARGLVEVRPAHPTEGADPAAVVTRIRAALAAGDLKTALAEWNTLPDDIKAKTAAWATTVETRLAVDDLISRLRAEALARLGSDG